MAPPDESRIVLDLFVAMLAVNRWTLERACEVSDGLVRTGLTDPVAVSSLPESEIARRLADAGYKRGSFMESLLARRIRRVSEVLAAGGVQELTQLEKVGDIDGTWRFLLKLEGVGSDVANSFLALRS